MTIKLLKITVIIFNALTSVMHIVFQFYLLKQQNIGVFTNFVLTENILIAMTFFLLSTALVISKHNKTITCYNTVIWLFFSVCIIILRPEHTTLDMFNFTIPISQWIILLSISLISLIVNLIYLTLLMRKSKAVSTH